MSEDFHRSHQDIAFFFPPNSSNQSQKRCNPFLIVALTVLITVLLIGLGYFAGMRAGYFAPIDEICCLTTLELAFDFEL